MFGECEAPVKQGRGKCWESLWKDQVGAVGGVGRAVVSASGAAAFPGQGTLLLKFESTQDCIKGIPGGGARMCEVAVMSRGRDNRKAGSGVRGVGREVAAVGRWQLTLTMTALGNY